MTITKQDMDKIKRFWKNHREKSIEKLEDKYYKSIDKLQRSIDK